ncbi:hypothetical protein Hanom_Chr06g00485821 [Helianthus anomalus]
MLILIMVRRFSRSETEVYQPTPSCLLLRYHHLPQIIIYVTISLFFFFFDFPIIRFVLELRLVVCKKDLCRLSRWSFVL